MDQTHGTPPIRPHWYDRHKRILLIVLGLLFLITFLLLAGLYIVISGKLNRYIANQVVETLGEYGLRTEIGDFEIAWRRGIAKISDAKVYNQQTGQLIATIEQAEMSARIPDLYAL